MSIPAAARNIARRWWGPTRSEPRWTDTLLVVELAPSPTSVHFRPYAEALDGSSVLVWAIDRVREMMGPGTPRPALLAPASEVKQVRSALGGLGEVLLQPMTPRGETIDLRDMASRTGLRRVLLVDLTGGVLPRFVWERLWMEHTTSHRHATLLDGTPCPSAPLLVEADWLRALALRHRGQAQDPRAAARAWLHTKQRAAKRRAAKVGVARPLRGDEATSQGWPYWVSIELPSDVEDLREAVRETRERSGCGRTGSEMLAAWAGARARRASGAGGLSRMPPHVDHRASGKPEGPVLYAQAPAAFAGCEHVAVMLAEQVAQRRGPRGCRALVSLPGTFSERLKEAGVPIEITNRDLAAPTRAHFAYCRVVLDSLDPALLHAHTVVGVPLAFALAERGVPLIQHVHVADERALGPLEDQILTASRVIAVSEFVRRRLARLGLDPARVPVIHNGIAVRSLQGEGLLSARRSVRQELGFSDHAHLILLPARFAPNKRQDVAVQVTAALAGCLREAHLVMAGEAYHHHLAGLDALEREVERRNLSRRVHFLGFREDMDRLYAAADALLLPAENDPLPLVVLEAMGAGVPVVASRSGGIPEMVEHGMSGLLVEPGDVNGFAGALRQVLTDGELRDHLVRGGRERVEAHFSVGRFVDEVLEVYNEVAESC